MRKLFSAAICVVGLVAATSSGHAHGALAVGDKGYGYAWNVKSKEKAARVAIEECKEWNKRCSVIGTFNDEWASFARSPASGRVKAQIGFATGKSKRQAVSKALQNCQKAGGRRCATLFAVEDTR